MSINLDQLLGGNNSGSVWDRYVPIVQEKNITKVYLTDTIDEPSCYNELCHKLYSASPAEEFQLFINNGGGLIDSAVMILDALGSTKAKTAAYISGTVASAATIITLACDEVVVSDHITFMIHNYSGGMVGKGHEMKAHQAFVDANLNASFKVFYKGFLSEKEMKEVIEGKDLWMGKEEIEARLAVKNGAMAPAKVIDEPEVEQYTPKKRGRPRKA